MPILLEMKKVKTLDFSWKNDDKGWWVDCEVSAHMVGYFPGDWNNPPEGGYLEDETFKPFDFRLKIGETYHEIELDDNMTKALVDYINKDYEENKDFQDSLYLKFEELHCDQY